LKSKGVRSSYRKLKHCWWMVAAAALSKADHIL
jgi:hypothetical protein